MDLVESNFVAIVFRLFSHLRTRRRRQRRLRSTSTLSRKCKLHLTKFMTWSPVTRWHFDAMTSFLLGKTTVFICWSASVEMDGVGFFGAPFWRGVECGLRAGD